MDTLKRALAPITNEAWKQIEETAAHVLKTSLSARKFVDVDGPKGWAYAAVPLGRLHMPDKQGAEGGIDYGTRMVQPLVEARVLFELDIWEIDNASRGAQDINLDSMEEAARKIALFEERAIYEGFESGQIRGLMKSSEHEAISFSGDVQGIVDVVSRGITKLAQAGINGPYRLVAGNQLWSEIASHSEGYPLRKHLGRLLEGEVILNPLLNDTLLVSIRGGDMLLTLGSDLAIGFNWADAKKVHLFFTESFTFQSIEPKAYIPITWQAGQ